MALLVAVSRKDTYVSGAFEAYVFSWFMTAEIYLTVVLSNVVCGELDWSGYGDLWGFDRC